MKAGFLHLLTAGQAMASRVSVEAPNPGDFSYYIPHTKKEFWNEQNWLAAKYENWKLH